MSNELIYTLISECELPQIEQLWADGVSDEVFSPFFACLIVNLADDKMNAWYKDFIKGTESAYHTALATGSELIGGNLYWQLPYHQTMAQKIAQATFVDDALLQTAFPLATHAGYDYIAEQADLLDMSVQDFAKSKLHTIASDLPAWAELVVAPEVLSQVSVTNLVNKTLQSDLGIGANSVDDDVFLVEHLDNPIEDDKEVTLDFTDDIVLSEDDFVLETGATTLAKDNAEKTNAQTAKALADTQDDWTLKSDVSPDNAPKSLADELDELNAMGNFGVTAAAQRPATLGLDDSIVLPKTMLDKSAPEDGVVDIKIDGLDDIIIDKTPSDDNSRQSDADSTDEAGVQTARADNVAPALLDDDEEERKTAPITVPKKVKKPKVAKKSSGNSSNGNALKIALPVLLLLAAVGGGGFWYYQNKMNAPAPEPVAVVAEETPAAPPLPVQSLPPSHLSMTVDELGNLYACRAELGNDALLQQVLALLQANFASTVCAMDVNNGVSQDMVGLDKLTSVIGLLKTSPFASLELSGDTLWIHSPNAEEVARLTRDMSALMEGAVKVVARPPLDRMAEIDASIAKGSSLMSGLAENADPHNLARAMSAPIFDLNTGAVPEANLLLLSAAAERLKAKPETRLIIVSHSDDTGDKAQARQMTKQRAELVKKALLDMGVTDHQLVAQGVGYDFPIMDNHTDLGRFKNNRIEFLVYEDGVFNALNAPAVQEQEAKMLAEQQAQANAQQQAQQAQAQMPPVQQPQALPPPQPTYGVVNGQIVEQGAPLPAAQFAPIQAPPPVSISSGSGSNSGGIDDDLLRPLGSEVGSGTASQVH